MKKVVFILAGFSATASLCAQKIKVKEAREFLSIQNYKKAIPLLNEAALNPETKNDAETWYLRGMAFLQQAIDTTAKEPAASEISYASLMKAIGLQPGYGSEINSALYSIAIVSFNDGVASYKLNPAKAYLDFMKVPGLYNAGTGKRFLENKDFTALQASAKSNAAYSAVNAMKDNDALLLLNEMRAAGAADENAYRLLIEIYARQGKEAEQLEAIDAAIKLYPDNQLFRNLELNYYIRKGQSDMLLTKLEAALKKDPRNPELLFNIANIYEKMAFPKSTSGVALPAPLNFSELFATSEGYYRDLLKVKPGNGDYHYNAVVLHYENAGMLNRKMQTLGMTAEEQKTYDSLALLRNDAFAKALPFLEGAYTMLDARSGHLGAEEKITYQNAMIGLIEIYSRTAKDDQLKTIKAKLASAQH